MRHSQVFLTGLSVFRNQLWDGHGFRVFELASQTRASIF